MRTDQSISWAPACFSPLLRARGDAADTRRRGGRRWSRDMRSAMPHGGADRRAHDIAAASAGAARNFSKPPVTFVLRAANYNQRLGSAVGSHRVPPRRQASDAAAESDALRVTFGGLRPNVASS